MARNRAICVIGFYSGRQQRSASCLFGQYALLGYQLGRTKSMKPWMIAVIVNMELSCQGLTRGEAGLDDMCIKIRGHLLPELCLLIARLQSSLIHSLRSLNSSGHFQTI